VNVYFTLSVLTISKSFTYLVTYLLTYLFIYLLTFLRTYLPTAKYRLHK